MKLACIHFICKTKYFDIQEIIDALIKFRNERDWEQFHNPKDLAIALSIEANELLELYLWKDKKEIACVDREKVKEELADVFAFSFLLAHKYDLDIKEIIVNKTSINSKMGSNLLGWVQNRCFLL